MRLSPVLAATGTYPFVRLEEAKRRLRARGIELIDFGKGDPREPTEGFIRQALVDALPEVAPYPLAEGLPELREAVARWCGLRFGVAVDPDTEVVPTYGSKEAIFHLAQVVLDRGSDKRVVITTEPGYPVPERGALFAGGEVVQVPLLEENGFLRDAAERAREHGVLLAADEAYTELWFDEPPHSALEVRELGPVAVFNTLSKRSSMTGYRSGFVVADAELIAALKQYRPSVGTAPQEFVQRASVAAWDDEAHVERTRERYRRKRSVLLPALERKGIRVAGRAATMYLWLEAPRGETSEELAERLLEHGLIVSPGTFFGPAGTGYWRIALVPTLEECERAARILEDVL
jgi:aspartate/methionine/tyrosine aminotransferase